MYKTVCNLKDTSEDLGTVGKAVDIHSAKGRHQTPGWTAGTQDALWLLHSPGERMPAVTAPWLPQTTARLPHPQHL